MALCALAPSLASDDVASVRASLDKGHTLKAARRAEKALETADPAAATELRYLRFRAYVMDLEQGNGDLVKKTVGEVNPDAMERYDAILDSLESKVRADGAAALPVVVGALVEGDALDRLLSLGLLQTMRRDSATTAGSLNAWFSNPRQGTHQSAVNSRRTGLPAARAAATASVLYGANRMRSLESGQIHQAAKTMPSAASATRTEVNQAAPWLRSPRSSQRAVAAIAPGISQVPSGAGSAWPRK